MNLAQTSSALKNLRVSFAPTDATQGTATYYECDLNEAQTVVSNCAAIAAKGSYSIDTINGARVLRFAGQPPTRRSTTTLPTRDQWTAGDPSSRWVYRAHEVKPQPERAPVHHQPPERNGLGGDEGAAGPVINAA